MLLRKVALFAGLLLLLIGAGMVVWLWQGGKGLYSNPTAVRTNDTYLRAHAPATNIPPVPPTLFDSITVTESETEISIANPVVPYILSDRTFGTLHVHHAGESQTVRIGDGSISLLYIGTAYGTNPPANPRQHAWEVDGKYFKPDLTPIGPDEMLGVLPKRERKMHFNGEFPRVKFYFAGTNLPPMKALDFALFDARTRHPLTGGHSRAGLHHAFRIETEAKLWHSAPVELVFTIATGPLETFSMPAREAAELKFSGGHMRLILVTEHDLAGWSSSQQNGTNTMTFDLQASLTVANEDKPKTSFVFFCWPMASKLPVDIEFLGADGKELPGPRGSGSSEQLLTASVQARPDEVHEVRIKYYPNVHRLIFTLPELPGLPEENRNLDNLFDVHIPFMRFRYEYAFRQNIAELVQMSEPRFQFNYPTNFFPATRTNTTARQLFHELAEMRANKQHQFVADPERNVIETRPDPIRAFLDKVKKKLGL